MAVNPVAQMLMPLCQQAISSMLPQPNAEPMLPLSIQLDEQFADMAERYFDNIYDGRMEVPKQFIELIKRYSCKDHEHATMHHEHAETHAKMKEHHEWGESAPHRVFMAAVDKIAVSPMKADEIIAEHFHDLTEDEKRVLKHYAKVRPTTKAQAQGVNMSEELYTTRLETLMTKTKYT